MAEDGVETDPLMCLSPLDGRYKSRVGGLSDYFSEASLFKYRCKIEIEYFIALAAVLPQLEQFPKDRFNELRAIYQNFGLSDAKRVKKLESTTNHDVKALEYFIKEEYDKLGLPDPCKEFIHFGLTSQDVNNTAVPLSIKDSLENCIIPTIKSLCEELKARSHEWKDIPMLARTHGQAASPTRLGKEMMVFVERLEKELNILGKCSHEGKFGGATGGFNAHRVAYPKIDWESFGNKFVTDIGLSRQQFTTQIEHYDGMAGIFHCLSRINTIFVDLCRDIWGYISIGYFGQKVKKDEVGSSAMPHKVNPIDFENAEGNLGIANALFVFFAQKLPISRFQRDLTDSTVSRAIGTPMGHSLLAYKSLKKGLSKITVNRKIIENDLEENWAVVSEAVQTVLRREGFPKPYEALKELTRTGDKITQATMTEFIQQLNVSETTKAELAAITPHNYLGYSF
eukprot:m.45830 g.45830  ORF g.45830 m.45830 type:complete len:454 (+) comp10299_c0_seq1:27-1388(+)